VSRKKYGKFAHKCTKNDIVQIFHNPKLATLSKRTSLQVIGARHVILYAIHIILAATCNIVLDYSRTFDSLRHSPVHENLDKLSLPDNVHNWLTDYFEGHSHSTRFDGVTSTLRTINASIIQGSAIGPAACIVCVADLRPITPDNNMSKYADDVMLIVAASRSATIENDLEHIKLWSERRNLRLNRSKCAEIIFRACGV